MKLFIQKYIKTMILLLVLTNCDGSNNDTPNNVLPVTQMLNNSTLSKTGQTISYKNYDDGYYKMGLTKKYSKDKIKQVVTDNLTKLMWQDDVEPTNLTITWFRAEAYCKNLTLASYTDWRLPTRKELLDLIDYGKYNPSIDKAFENIEVYNNWTSTVPPSHTDSAWTVFFISGGADYAYKSNYGSVRCVRTQK